MSELPTITIYTDGGCRPNPGPGGWGAVLLRPGKRAVDLSGGDDDSTNNRMELTAALEALRSLDEPHRVELVTDSQYLKKGVTEWLAGWQAKGWRTAGKTAVKNQDLWQGLAAELARHRVSWRWVKGHAGDRWNERADRLASSAMARETLPVEDSAAVHLFVAAAFSGRQKLGAWGLVLRFRDTVKTDSGVCRDVTPNRMHIQSAITGLERLTRAVRVHLYTSSDYLKDGATSWTPGWRARGWTTRDGKAVQHRDLWEALAALGERHRIEWHVAPRDAGIDELDQAKDLAQNAIKDA